MRLVSHRHLSGVISTCTCFAKTKVDLISYFGDGLIQYAQPDELLKLLGCEHQIHLLLDLVTQWDAFHHINR